MNFRRRPAGVSFYLRDSSHRYRSILRIGLFLALLVVAPARLTAQGVGSTPTPAMPAQRRLIRPTLPPSASQADAGAQVYTLVCSACHGDLGQGLTDEWRATWNPSDQNCWQSKCHGLNRPSDGFDLPRYVPPRSWSRSPGPFPYCPRPLRVHPPGDAMARTRQPARGGVLGCDCFCRAVEWCGPGARSPG